MNDPVFAIVVSCPIFLSVPLWLGIRPKDLQPEDLYLGLIMWAWFAFFIYVAVLRVD